MLSSDPEYLNHIRDMEAYILSELNVREVVASNDETKYGLTLSAEPDLKIVGKRLGADLKKVRPAILGT